MDDRNQSSEPMNQGQSGGQGGQNQDRQQNVDRQQNQQGGAKTDNANRDGDTPDSPHQGGASGQGSGASQDTGGQTGGETGGGRGMNSDQR